tara:strand:+ start:308 stop:487 length:180 start_codon:yes stop_codon:yes gene_type:complete
LTGLYSLGKQTITGIFPPNKNKKITKSDLSMVICNKFKLFGCDPAIKKFSKYYRKEIIK